MAMSPNPRSQDRSEERAGHQAARRPCFSVPSPIRQWDHMVLISLSSVCCLYLLFILLPFIFFLNPL